MNKILEQFKTVSTIKSVAESLSLLPIDVFEVIHKNPDFLTIGSRGELNLYLYIE
jgi:hypothetical protein